MYPGYLAIGDIGAGVTYFELVNTNRVLAYAEFWNAAVLAGSQGGSCINWLQACDDCIDLELVLTDGAGYSNIVGDPAPWYDPLRPEDSSQFLGVLGLAVDGAEDSTAKASVLRSIGSGGVVGKLYFDAREMVVRGLAVATSECGLAFGLSYLRNLYTTQVAVCGGDDLVFLDCCPECGLEELPGIDWCWADIYQELKDSPTACAGNWWPTTYQELKDGPPANDPYWCAWVQVYRQLRDDGPAAYACETGDCVNPYLRAFDSVRLISGPTIIRKQTVGDGHRIAEIEFTVVAANPEPEAVTVPLAFNMAY